MGKLGENIKRYREIYGISQLALAQELAVGPTTVSMWENNNREPDSDMIDKLAKVFMCSVDQLLNGEINENGTMPEDPSIFTRNIDTVFPIIKSKNAMEDERFKRAHKLHETVYNEIKHNTSMEHLESCIDCYESLYENNLFKPEAAANLVGLWCFLYMSIKFASQFGNGAIKPAIYCKMSKSSSLVREYLDKTMEPDFNNGINEALNAFDNVEFYRMLYDYLRTLMAFDDYVDLAYYYVAVQHLYGIACDGNELGVELQIGDAMIKEFAMLGNKYALNLHGLSQDLIGTSQNVNDK